MLFSILSGLGKPLEKQPWGLTRLDFLRVGGTWIPRDFGVEDRGVKSWGSRLTATGSWTTAAGSSFGARFAATTPGYPDALIDQLRDSKIEGSKKSPRDTTPGGSEEGWGLITQRKSIKLAKALRQDWLYCFLSSWHVHPIRHGDDLSVMASPFQEQVPVLQGVHPASLVLPRSGCQFYQSLGFCRYNKKSHLLWVAFHQRISFDVYLFRSLHSLTTSLCVPLFSLTRNHLNSADSVMLYFLAIHLKDDPLCKNERNGLKSRNNRDR